MILKHLCKNSTEAVHIANAVNMPSYPVNPVSATTVGMMVVLTCEEVPGRDDEWRAGQLKATLGACKKIVAQFKKDGVI